MGFGRVWADMAKPVTTRRKMALKNARSRRAAWVRARGGGLEVRVGRRVGVGAGVRVRAGVGVAGGGREGGEEEAELRQER